MVDALQQIKITSFLEDKSIFGLSTVEKRIALNFWIPKKINIFALLNNEEGFD